MEVKELFGLALQEHKKKNFLSAEKFYKQILKTYLILYPQCFQKIQLNQKMVSRMIKAGPLLKL